MNLHLARRRGAPPWLLPAAAAVSLTAVGAALVSQHVFEMLPCPWCVLQRLVFVAIAVAALLAWMLPAALPRRLGAALMLALCASGVAAALWQHNVAASSTSCNLTLADRIVAATGLDERWPEIFAAYASCADAKVDLFGLPYEYWSLALFIALGAVAAQVLRRPG